MVSAQSDVNGQCKWLQTHAHVHARTCARAHTHTHYGSYAHTLDIQHLHKQIIIGNYYIASMWTIALTMLNYVNKHLTH
jgi:hypothetical protein